jgi:hypothetical protein
MSGIIYIFTNPSFPDWIKIGRCSDLNKRLASLSSNTCLPFPFQCFYACEVDQPKTVEATLHYIFDNFRISPKREFFNVDPEQVIAALSLMSGVKYVQSPEKLQCPDDINSIDKELRRQSQFSFSAAGIALGDKIDLIRMPEVSAIVVSDAAVEIDGQTMSLNQATSFCLLKYCSEKKSKIGSPRYWSYEGEMLVKRKNRIQNPT